MPDLSYDPYDFAIHDDPHPVWRRMRDETPLYRNDKHDFWALTRFEDVSAALADWRTYSSARGTVLEIIRSGAKFPPGIILFEDPPLHDAHRALLARLFTPRRISELEPQIRDFCARSLDPLVGSGRFDFIADLGSQMPMRVIGMLLGIPDEDQEALRNSIDAGLSLEKDKSASAISDAEAQIFLGATLLGVHRVAPQESVGRPDDRAAERALRGWWCRAHPARRRAASATSDCSRAPATRRRRA